MAVARLAVVVAGLAEAAPAVAEALAAAEALAVVEDLVSVAAAAEDEDGSRSFNQTSLRPVSLRNESSKHFNKSRRGCLGAREGPGVVFDCSRRSGWVAFELEDALASASSCWDFPPDGAAVAAGGAETASATEPSRQRGEAPVRRMPRQAREQLGSRRPGDSECRRTRQRHLRGSVQRSVLAAVASVGSTVGLFDRSAFPH